MTAAVLIAVWLRRRRTQSVWPYVIGRGSLSWAALYLGGFHPALALVPNRPIHAAQPTRRPVQFVLLPFGFANAGVPFEQIGAGTYYVRAGLLLGKPIGILVFSGAARFGVKPALWTSNG